MNAKRRAEGLQRPYGDAAVAKGLGPKRPRYRYVADADTGLMRDLKTGNLVNPVTGDIVVNADELAELPLPRTRNQPVMPDAYEPAENERPTASPDGSGPDRPAEPPGDPPPAPAIDPDELPF
ncbi:MAG: hypothetical protein IRZ21_03100 [Thermoleophilaceae bacterium]|nr:hypothetical protein [Thermoleophilaceae bacterium]